MIRRVLAGLLFQAGWLSAVLGAAWGAASTGAGIAIGVAFVNVVLSSSPRRVLAFVGLVAVAGPPADWLLVRLRLLSPTGWPETAWFIPIWLWALWPLFASVVPLCFDWLAGRYVLALVLGALAGPATYWGASRLGAAELHHDTWPSLAAVSLEWGVMLPALMLLYRLVVLESAAVPQASAGTRQERLP
ncbi:MAG: DUF2878 domain-containing protein [Acidobacteriota bacterium]|nr:DUF2878 domain-containing protein [Acidobacteriota bacterium]